MQRLSRKEDYFIEAGSLDELAVVLASRCGGTADGWKAPIKEALKHKTLRPTIIGGKKGYRTRTREEHEKAAAKAAQTMQLQQPQLQVA